MATNRDKPPDAPVYDDAGINLADPNDRLGVKTEYISRLQTLAIARYVGQGSGLALDLGCGYGRMTRRIGELGYDVVGLDPSLRVLRHAASESPRRPWCVGALPRLPFADGAFPLVMMLNVIRALHLLGVKEVCVDAARVVAKGGRLVIVDNMRRHDDRYVDEHWLVDFFGGCGLRLRKRVAIRASRWPLIYLIRYGLVPHWMLDRLAMWELSRMARKKKPPRWGYHNVLFIFERP